MKKIFSALSLYVFCFILYFVAALAKGLPRNLSVGFCAAVSAVMALISVIAYYLYNKLKLKEGNEEA